MIVDRPTGIGNTQGCVPYVSPYLIEEKGDCHEGDAGLRKCGGCVWHSEGMGSLKSQAPHAVLFLLEGEQGYAAATKKMSDQLGGLWDLAALT